MAPNAQAQIAAVVSAMNANGLPFNRRAVASPPAELLDVIGEKALTLSASGRLLCPWLGRGHGVPFTPSGAAFYLLTTRAGLFMLGDGMSLYAALRVEASAALPLAASAVARLGAQSVIAVLGERDAGIVVLEFSPEAVEAVVSFAHGAGAQAALGWTVGAALAGEPLNVNGPGFGPILTRAELVDVGIKALGELHLSGPRAQLYLWACAVAARYAPEGVAVVLQGMQAADQADARAALAGPDRVAARIKVCIQAHPEQALSFRDDCDAADFLISNVFGADPSQGFALAHDGDRWLRYDAAQGPTWRKAGDAEILADVMKLSGIPTPKVTKDGAVEIERFKLSTTRAKSIMEALRVKVSDPGWHDRGVVGVACGASVVTLAPDGRVTARAMTGEDRILDGAALPFDYDAGAECPRWLSFLSDPATGVWGAESDCADRVRLLREWLGAALIGEVTRYQCALLLVGEGSNGKSAVVSSITRGLFPEARRLALEWHDLEGSEKGNTIAALRGVRLAFDGDLSAARPLESTGTLKKLISGDELRGRALYANGIEVKPAAGWLAACNRIPTTRDTSEGFFRRMLILTFNRTYAVPDDAGHVEEGKLIADETLGEVLAQELPGILRWALGGVADLRRRGGYAKPSSVVAAREDQRAGNDAIGAYLSQAIDPGLPEKRLTTQELYDDFRDWCKDNGFDRPASSMTFAKQIKGASVNGALRYARTASGAAYFARHTRIGSAS